MNKFVISKERENELAYAVCRIEVPPMPNGKPFKEDVRGNGFAVLAANDDGHKWGFITMNAKEKEAIGDQLRDLGIEPGVWVWCSEFEDNK